MAESDRRHAKRRADRRNQQPKQETKPHETVEPGQHGTNLVDDPMTMPQPSSPCQLIPNGPSIPLVPVSWPPVPANWTQFPAPPPVIWLPVLINWAYPARPPISPIFPPPIPFPKLLPPLSPQQADNSSAAPRIPPLPPQINPPALLESLPKNHKLGKTIVRYASRPGQPNSYGKKYQGGCSAQESDSKEEMNAGTFESLSACAVMGNNTSITITITGVQIDMDSDVEVEVDGSENSSLDRNLDADENSSKEESSEEEESSGEEENPGEEENSDSDEKSK
ncbi:hypothetical protein K435DRAFT_865604 [Dendrothele bispora CBS 962.96]|uniref:Uncharacterized protein n=1 Tax=Dendrothele bispora (strain CBS 962.96) TaxID=1314807 RepID=A0A4S8LJP6_DENBC|nr:hypothetical protein K435DRAFT_865604 [Dendrothele bispora CBS 962.96]